MQFLHFGTACMSLWAAESFLPDVYPPDPVEAPSPADAAAAPESKSKRKKNSEKLAPAAPPPPSTPKANAPGVSRLRIALIPILPFLTWSILRTPTLPHPLLEPFQHPSAPLRILSSVDSTYSGVVVVGETGEPGWDAFEGINSMRYLRAGHSILGGVWVGSKAAAFEGALPEDESGHKLGDSIYSAFVLQEAALLAKKPENAQPKNALIMYVPSFVRCLSF